MKSGIRMMLLRTVMMAGLALAAASAHAQSFTAVSSSPTALRHYLGPNEYLPVGGYLTSRAHSFIGVQQPDGNFCIYRGSGMQDKNAVLWCTGPTGGGGRFFMVTRLGDSRLCIQEGASPASYRADVQPLWCTPANLRGSFLILNDDGNLCFSQAMNAAGSSTADVWCSNVVDRDWLAQSTGTKTVPPAPPRRGVVVKNESASYAWMTIYSSTIGIRTIKASGCLMPGQENSYDVVIVAAGAPKEQVIVRVERLRPGNCADPVTCDTEAAWDKLGETEGAIRYTNNPSVLFSVKDDPRGGCYVRAEN